MKIEKVIASVFAEIERAETLHPAWPRDPVKACSLLVEEAGEAVRAANTFDETRAGKKRSLPRQSTPPRPRSGC